MSVKYTKEERKNMAKTYRNTGAIGKKALVPKHAEAILRVWGALGYTDQSVLDYGAGKAAAHAIALRIKGFRVTAYEIPENFVEGVHDPKALSKKYDMVMASNVLNVQPSRETVREVIGELFRLTKRGGCAVMNFPKTPRHNDLTEKDLERMLREVFGGEFAVERHGVVFIGKKL